jgi:iron complex outermembrane receptor protein
MLGLRLSLLVGISASTYAILAGSAFGQAQGQGNETVIVTGTRVQGMTAADSAAPITVLGADALSHGTGSTDLRQQLGQSVPSFTAEQQAFDTANLTLSAALRGLSPNDTLVLVNGHRRHYSGNLHVDAGSLGSASDAADLSLIPSAAIDHVEVLLDGAAAQYGTDAVAGVVNIILKNKSSGGQLSAQAGDYFNSGGIPTVNGLKSAGTKYDVAYNMGLPLFDKGFINFTIDKAYGNYTQVAGADVRVAGQGPTGEGLQTTPLVNPASNTGSPDIPLAVAQKMPGYPRINPIEGLPEYQLTQAEVNSSYDFNDNLSIYAFGTIARRFGKSYQNVRLPDQNIATPGSSQACSATNLDGYNTVVDSSGSAACAPGVVGNTSGDGLAGTASPIPTANGPSVNGLNPVTGQVVSSGNAGSYTSPGELIQYPEGMRPLEVLQEDDYQYNVGEKFNVAGWAVDFDVGYGKDIDKISTWNSGNRSLFIDTHSTPTNFYDGRFTGSQFTGTIDATHPFNVGMASPLTVAIGGEAREDTYSIGAGDSASYYKEGPQSFPGFPLSAAGNHSRKNYAGYIDLAVAPIEALQLDVAGRAEHYTDFGDTQIGKITARYDITPQWAIRGTISTGFRAPTLAEEFYTAVNVSPVSATLQLPADSAGAKLLGLQNLKPEISTSYSAGIVAHPFEDLSATVDFYSIAVGNRITSSSTIQAAGGAINAPVVFQAIAAAGVTLDPTATQPGVTAFLNAISSLTQGVDLTINYPTDLGDYGLINWTLAGNYNQTAISSVAPTPAVILASNPGATFFTEGSNYNFVHSSPQDRVTLTAEWILEPFGLTVRESYWGPQHNLTSVFGTAPFTNDNQAGVVLTDVEARYNVTEQIQFAIGANNIFNIRPDIVPWGGVNNSNYGPGYNTDVAGNIIAGVPAIASFDPNGGYYYGRLTYNF